MKMISADHYMFYMEELQAGHDNDGKSEVHFRWDKVKKKWLVTWKGERGLSESAAAQLIAAAVAKGLPPSPTPTHIPKPP